MNKEHLIPAVEFCARHEIELGFINSLHEFGLIKIITLEQTAFITSEELPKLEQILLFNKELEINLEGVEVIMHLLDRVHKIQYEVNTLRNRLGFYESI